MRFRQGLWVITRHYSLTCQCVAQQENCLSTAAELVRLGALARDVRQPPADSAFLAATASADLQILGLTALFVYRRWRAKMIEFAISVRTFDTWVRR